MRAFFQQATVLSLFAAVITQAWAQTASVNTAVFHFAVVDQSALSELEISSANIQYFWVGHSCSFSTDAKLLQHPVITRAL